MMHQMIRSLRHVLGLSVEEFQSFWHGERLTPSAIYCLNSFGVRGFGVTLYTYGPVEDVPEFVVCEDANEPTTTSLRDYYPGRINRFWATSLCSTLPNCSDVPRCAFG
jgi:hypothetical protein